MSAKKSGGPLIGDNRKARHIYEYLENSFESLLWDWGYFALIIGK